MGIMAGVGTVLADDPDLTCRLEGMKSPVRIICDTNLRTPLTAKIVTSAKETPVILATAVRDEETIRPYTERGCRVLQVPLEKDHIDLQILMQKLGEMGIDSILLEGGGALNYSALQSGIVQQVEMYIAPKLFGGAGAKTPVMGEGVKLPLEAFPLCRQKIEQIGEDILIVWEVKPCLRES